MPKYRSVYGCFSSPEKDPGLSFFHFPKDVKLLKAWTCRIRRENFNPTSSSYVCSRHFAVNDFTNSNTDTPSQFKKKSLKKGVVPSKNLRGQLNDENIPKRPRPRKRADTPGSVESFLSNREEAPADGIALFTDISRNIYGIPDDGTDHDKDEQISILTEKLHFLEMRRCLFRNLGTDSIKSYTGIDHEVFEVIVAMIERFQLLKYWSGKPVRSITSEDQLLILLILLKLNLPYYDIAQRYGVSQTTVQNVVMTFLHAMHEIFFTGIMDKLPTQNKNKASLPDSFGDFSNCRIIIDCTELRVSTPRKDLIAASVSYSNYKHFLSIKYLVGVAPSGAITFLSKGFPGSTSDKVVTAESGVISHLMAGDLILADKGFLIHDLLPNNVFLNLPAFLCSKSQLTKEEAMFSRKISGCRIHVERAIERLRNYKILDFISKPLQPFADKIIQVCAVLVNFQSPIIYGAFDEYNSLVSSTASD